MAGLARILVAQFLTGIFIQLSQQKFIDTKELTKYFPTDLLKETETVIGQPDARDWGELYVMYNFNGLRKFWLLDQKKVMFRQNITSLSGCTKIS